MSRRGTPGVGDDLTGAQIRAARTHQGLSLRSLARAIHVSPATVSQIELGRTGLSLARLHQIAAAIGVTAQEILDLDPTGATGSAPESSGGDMRIVRPGRQAPEPGPGCGWRSYGPLPFDVVLAAALDEFVHIGYHGATVREIAARAGLSVPGIYHYYTSKQQMLMTILEYTMTDLLERATAARRDGADPVERFSLQVEHLVLFHTHRAELGFVGAAEKRSLDPDNSRRIAALRTRQQRFVDEEVAEAVELGLFRSDGAHERARSIVTMCTALPTWWRPEGRYSPEEIAEQYVSIARDLMLRSTTDSA